MEWETGEGGERDSPPSPTPSPASHSARESLFAGYTNMHCTPSFNSFNQSTTNFFYKLRLTPLVSKKKKKTSSPKSNLCLLDPTPTPPNAPPPPAEYIQSPSQSPAFIPFWPKSRVTLPEVPRGPRGSRRGEDGETMHRSVIQYHIYFINT